MSLDVDIRALSNVILQKCLFIPATSRSQLEQVLFYIQKRGNQRISARSRSSSAVSFDRRPIHSPTISAELGKIDVRFIRKHFVDYVKLRSIWFYFTNTHRLYQN